VITISLHIVNTYEDGELPVTSTIGPKTPSTR
jgi:hypothetical protein